MLLPEVSAVTTNNWRGYSLASGFPRQTNAVSIFYAFVDDANRNGQVDAGDSFVVSEFLVTGTMFTTNTLVRLPITASSAAQSYGLTSVNILNSSNEVFFTGEPDGNVYSWVATNGTGPLQRQFFDGHYQGKAWHQLSAYRGLDPGEGLAGLMVDPASPNTCQLVFWKPQQSIPTLPNVPETPPTTLIMPTSNSGGALSTVNITIWKAEGNNCYPVLQYQNPTTLNWLNATIQTIDGVAYLPTLAVTTMPTGTLHAIVWNAVANFGAPYTNNILLRAQSHDFMLTGSWSPTVSYSVAIPADTVGDGIPNSWRQQYFGGDGSITNNLSCATCDYDGTGQNNLFKYVAGLDPTNPASVFTLNIVLGSFSTGLVAYYPFNGNANDASGNGRDLTLVGATQTNGIRGAGLFFSGSPNEYALANPFNGFPNQELSVAFWVKSTNTNDRYVLSYFTTEDAFRLSLNQAGLRIDVDNVGSAQSGVSVSDGNWHHVVVSWRRADGATQVYTNGMLAWSGTYATGANIGSTGSFVLGQEQNSSGGGFNLGFTGSLDEVFVYNHALSPSEVQQLYQPTQPILLYAPVAGGRTYTPEFSTNLTLGGWSPLTSFTGPVTNGNQATIIDTNAVEPQKFYRIDITYP